MALKAMIENLDAVEADLRELYAPGGDGKFRLAVEDPESLVDTKGLKSALAKERAQARELAARLKDFQGMDPAEFRKLKQESARREQRDLAKAGRWDDLKARLAAEHREALDQRDRTIARLKTDLSRHLMDSAATHALARAGGMPALLLPHVKARLEVVESESGHTLRVIDESGQARTKDGEPLSLEDLVAEMRSDPVFAPAFQGNGGSGGGAPAGAGSTGSPRPGDLLSRSREALKKGDVALSLKLKNEHFARRQAGVS
jgi:hypothetical protein